MCDSKLKSGHLTKTDVDTSVQLVKLADNITELNKISLQRAFSVGDNLVLVLGVGDLNYVRRNHGIIKKLEGAMGMRLWALEGDTSDRKIIEDLFYPIRILTVNVVWLPDGSKLTKVIIPGRRTPRFPIDTEAVKQIVKAVKGIDLLVEFEK